MRSVLEDFTERLTVLDAEALGAEMYGAPNLNSFAMFGPDERPLADLLDPKGRHGQGGLFLNAFLGEVGLANVRRTELSSP